MQTLLFPDPDKPKRRSPMLYQPSEYKLVTMRECVCPPDILVCDTPERAADYWRLHVEGHPYFNPDVECMVALLLNTRRRVLGHHLIATGTLDTILCHPRELFRAAVVAAAHAVVLMHNHTSGDPSPSEADIKVTRDMVTAGRMMKIEVIDHVVMGRMGGSHSMNPNKGYISLRELGYLY
jgi:DNA repair protein RadC